MPEQKLKLKDLQTLLEKGGNDATLLVLKRIYVLEELLGAFEENHTNIRKKLSAIEQLIEANPHSSAISDEAKIERISTKLATKMANIEKGDKGDKGEDGHTPSKDEIVRIIVPLIPEVKDGQDGKDADEDLIVRKVVDKIEVPKIEDIENDLPKLGVQIRDALELLKDDNRLDMNVIKGLEDRFDELKKMITTSKQTLGAQTGFNAGALDMHITNNEVLGTGDGSETGFTLNHQPSPTTSLEVWVGGGRLFETDDWTLSGKTITFITAPPNGAKIRASYRH